ncbi:MAG: hypothetical protein ABSH34_09525 [Verrucomicrobiota bacterium]
MNPSEFQSWIKIQHIGALLTLQPVGVAPGKSMSGFDAQVQALVVRF